MHLYNTGRVMSNMQTRSTNENQRRKPILKFVSVPFRHKKQLFNGEFPVELKIAVVPLIDPRQDRERGRRATLLMSKPLGTDGVA